MRNCPRPSAAALCAGTRTDSVSSGSSRSIARESTILGPEAGALDVLAVGGRGLPKDRPGKGVCAGLSCEFVADIVKGGVGLSCDGTGIEEGGLSANCGRLGALIVLTTGGAGFGDGLNADGAKTDAVALKPRPVGANGVFLLARDGEEGTEMGGVDIIVSLACRLAAGDDTLRLVRGDRDLSTRLDIEVFFAICFRTLARSTCDE
jgi:hypothetical protein